MNFEAHYEREDNIGWFINSWEDASQLLELQQSEGPSYTIFTIKNGSYVQCAGGPSRLTVEARVLNPSSFRHFRFGKGQLSKVGAVIRCNCGPILVDQSQVLQMQDARLIIKYFVESDGGLLSSYSAKEITDVF